VTYSNNLFVGAVFPEAMASQQAALVFYLGHRTKVDISFDLPPKKTGT
jgi:hypothetical protein